MDILSGIISLKCVEHQEKIEFKMSQITTKTIHIVQEKRKIFFFLIPHFVSIRFKIT